MRPWMIIVVWKALSLLGIWLLPGGMAFISPRLASFKPMPRSSRRCATEGPPAGPMGPMGHVGKPRLHQQKGPGRKMGGNRKPQRHHPQGESSQQIGRVSVYCVGSAIDLDALRAFVFRQGFAPAQDHNNRLALARRSEEADMEGVVHVSNAPLFVPNQLDPESGTSNPLPGHVPGHLPVKPITEDWEQLSWKAKEMLVMATQDVFYFGYGCVVFWGLTVLEEKAALKELEAFTVEPVKPVELENSFDTMEFVFDRYANPQQHPVRFDRMKLRSLKLDEKLALSYAMAQSSKLFVFEQKVLESVERTRYLPKELALQGKISCSKKDLNRLIGQLFVEQTEVNLFSSILDTPDFLWDDDEYFSVYSYTRSYLEVDDRVQLLNSRLSVIRELLDVLTAQVADTSSTRLEWIVIWLITVEIVMGIALLPALTTMRKIIAASLVPTAILLYKKFD